MSPKKKLDTDLVISELSEESAFFQSTSTQTHKPTSGQTDKPAKPQVEKYTTHLQPATIKAVKRYAFEHEMKDYEVMQQAIDAYLEGDPRIMALETEIQQLQERLTIEQRFRTDTGVHHFKNWLRTHDQPQDSDFAKRFLTDVRLPQHASRGMYEAKLRTGGYSEEDIQLFQDAWKAMLFTQ